MSEVPVVLSSYGKNINDIKMLEKLLLFLFNLRY